MKKSKLGLLAITLCLSTLLYAQGNYVPGYVITNQQDTVAGWINLRTDKNNQKQCEFKPDLKSATKTYLPGDIAGYRFTDAGKYYVSREIELNGTHQKVFLEFLVKGLMNLYYYTDDVDYYFFEREDGTMEVISQKPEKIEDGIVYEDTRYMGQIRHLFQDYPPIAQEAGKLKFDQKSMIKVVKDYHNEACTSGESCIVFQNEHPDDKGIKTKISIYTGLQLSNYTFSNDVVYQATMTQTVSNVSPVLGAQINLMSPRWSKSFSIQFDVSLSQFKGDMPNKIIRYVGTGNKADVTDKVRPYTNEYGKLTSYKALATSFRFGVKYTYPKYRIAPTAEAGIAYTHLGGELAKIGMLPGSFFGYYLALGADYRIKTSSAIFIRLVYEDYPLTDVAQKNGIDKISMPHVKIGYTF